MIKPIFATGLFLTLSLASVKLDAVLPQFFDKKGNALFTSAKDREFLDSLKPKPYDWSNVHRLTRLTLAGGILAATRFGAFSLSALIAPAPIALAPAAPLHPDMGG